MMKKFFLLFMVFLLPLCVGGKVKYDQNQFVNILNIQTGNDSSPNGYFFSDLGNWHGYGFNDESAIKITSGFRGPAFMGEKKMGLQWLSDSFGRMVLMENNTEIPYYNLSNDYLPGMLRQKLQAGAISICLKAIFISSKTSIIEYELFNNDDIERNIDVVFNGEVSYKNAKCSIIDKKYIHVSVIDNVHNFVFSFQNNGKLYLLDNNHYEMRIDNNILKPGKRKTFYLYCTYSPSTLKNDILIEHKNLESLSVVSLFKDNKKRWNKYINSILCRKTPYLRNEDYRNWAIKALMTLNTNWRNAAGDLKHGGIQPAAGHFDAFWAWDSWIHAVAAAIFNPELAKEQMLTMFDYQTPEGMVIDLISLDKRENNTLCSKPPIAGWATYMVYKRTKDKDFLRVMLPKLLKFHEWRYKYRDHDKNGLCEYGGIDNKVYMGQWESGMDVAVKFDGVKMLKNGEKAYSFDQESVELNCYLCAEKFYLAYMLEEVGEKNKADDFVREGVKLRKIIQELFYDEETGYFYDRKLGSGKLVKIIDISGWIPLFTGVATPEQAASVKRKMLDKDLFGTYFPFSSLNHKHPLYQPDKGYFRGQTWLNYTYFGIRGWKNYGFYDDAEKYTWLLPKRLKGLIEKGAPIQENWNSSNGEPMSAMHFGWSSAFSILLLTEDVDSFPYCLNQK